MHPGQWSLPSCAAWIAGPIRPHLVGLCRNLRLKNPVGSGPVKVKYIQHSGGGVSFSACWDSPKQLRLSWLGSSIATGCRLRCATLRALCAARCSGGRQCVGLHRSWCRGELPALLHWYQVQGTVPQRQVTQRCVGQHPSNTQLYCSDRGVVYEQQKDTSSGTTSAPSP